MSEVCSEHEYYMLAVTLHHLSNFSQDQLSNGKKINVCTSICDFGSVPLDAKHLTTSLHG